VPSISALPAIKLVRIFIIRYLPSMSE
jgi:hypothetical protein